MLEKSLKNTIEKNNVKSVLLGLSGGVDSVVLLHLLSSIKDLNLRAVYVNHGLSEYSKDWEDFCKNLCSDLNIDFYSYNVDCTLKNRESLEAVAREKRYEVYKSLLEDNEFLCLGQHSDDQVETVLLQLFRGTGLSGLSGMPLLESFQNGFILRPFLDNDILDITKEVIVKYASDNSIEHIVDESNFSNEYRRNFLRNDIIPKLKDEFGNINKTICRTSNICSETQKFVEKSTLNIKKNRFDISVVENLEDFEIKNVIIKWIKNNKFQSLSSSKLNILVNFIKDYKTDSNFKLETKKYEIRHHDYFIYILDKNDTFSLENFLKQYQVKIFENSKFLFKKDIKNEYTLNGKSFNSKKYFRNLKIPKWEKENLPIQIVDKRIVSIGIRIFE